MSNEEIIKLDAVKSRKLFEKMKDLDFLTVIFTDEGATVYLKGDIKEEDMQFARQVIEQIEREES